MEQPRTMAGDEPSDSGGDASAIAASVAEPRAFTAIFDRHFDSIHAYLERRVGRDLAEEIAADTFTCAFDRRAEFDVGWASARPWLFGIAANLLRRHWRSERRRLEAYRRAAQGEPSVQESAGESVGPELFEALEELPRRDRETLLLYAWADLSYEEVAVALEVPIGTVRSRLARARRRLREHLLPDLSAPAQSPIAKEAASA